MTTTATKDLKAYEQFGVDLPEESNGTGQLVCDCILCGKEQHLYISSEDGRFHCKVCGAKGNKYSFLRLIYDKALAETNTNNYKAFSVARHNTPIPSLKEFGWAYDSLLERWMIPQLNAKGSLTNLCTYDPTVPHSRVFQTASCSLHLGRLETLKSTGPIFITEGPHDACALAYALGRMKKAPANWTVLWAPGADSLTSKTIKADIDAHLKGREVYLMFDNDDAGSEGMVKGAKILAPICPVVYMLTWPKERFTEGYDLDDYFRESTIPRDAQLDELFSWCFQYARGADPHDGPPKLKRDTLKQVIRDFEKTQVSMYPGLKDALALTLAVAYSIRMGGDPIWLYVIGDPGAGKSLVLEATLGSHWCVYRTSVTARSFISGYRGSEEEIDNSLLAIIPGRCLVVKDYSNVIALPQVSQDELVGMLRDAYDGRVVKNFGNKLYKEYPPPDSDLKDCRFSFVAGVTRAIHTHASTGLGERMLKFDITRSGRDDLAAIHAALDDSWDAHKRQLFRGASVSAFLSREVDPLNLPTLPKWYMNRLIAMIQFVGLCRTLVSRDNKGDLHYEPTPESGTRVAKQLKKLSQSLCWVFNLNIANQEVYRLVRQVAWDTSHGTRRNLYLIAYHLGEFSVDDLSDASGISSSATYRHVHDLHVLGVIRRIRRESEKGRSAKPRTIWGLTKHARDLIKHAHLEEMNK